MSCNKCYSTIYYYVYADTSGDIHGPLVWYTDFGVNKVAADANAIVYGVGTQHLCYYDPDNYDNVVYTKGYTWWKWFLTAWPTAFIFCLLTAGLAACLENSGEGKSYWAGPICCGFVIPFLVFLPIALAGNVGEAAKKALLVTVCVLATYSGAVSYYLRYNASGSSVFDSWLKIAVGLFGLIVPLGILLPIGIYSSGTAKAVLVAIGVVGPVLTLCFAMCGDTCIDAFDSAQRSSRLRAAQPSSPISVGQSHEAEMAAFAREREAVARAREELKAIQRENEELEKRLKREQEQLNGSIGAPAYATVAPAYGAPVSSPYTGSGQVPGINIVAAVPYNPYNPSATAPPAYTAPPPDYAAPPSYTVSDYPTKTI